MNRDEMPYLWGMCFVNRNQRDIHCEDTSNMEASFEGWNSSLFFERIQLPKSGEEERQP